jgi:DNA-binding NtrC family response regulator
MQQRASRPRLLHGAIPHPLLAALEELGAGCALVLDGELRIVGVTECAERVLDGAPLGTSAPKLLCGESVERPVAQALVEGRACAAIVPRPTAERPNRCLRVRAIPLGGNAKVSGWLLMLEEQREGDKDAELFHGMWSADPAMKQVFRVVEKVAGSDASVLVRGETGSGKELVANAVHAASARRNGPFRAINCAALPPALLESELFGHVRGAFTGAVRDNPGHFRLAHGGTLLLDEIAELPLDLQAKLLRVLATQTVIPVGGRDAVKVDVRVVAATHRSLRHEVEEKRFRADLMYRLRVIPIYIPPLRARGRDVLLLADKLVTKLNARGGREIARISPGAAQRLHTYGWPGNVRELYNVLEYAFVIGDGPVLVESDLPPEFFSSDPSPAAVANRPPPLDESQSRSDERERLLRALERASGYRERAAKMLGWSRVTLWRRMKELGVETAPRRQR